jgi:hypothetical protein
VLGDPAPDHAEHAGVVVVLGVLVVEHVQQAIRTGGDAPELDEEVDGLLPGFRS